MAQHDVNAFQNNLNVVGIKTVYETADPTAADISYRVPTLWVNTDSNAGFILTSVEGGAAHWIEAGYTVGPTQADDFYAADTAPPVGPAPGDTYILDETLPVDAGWTTAGATNDDIVIYAATGWIVYTPTQGRIIYDVASSDFYIYDGATWGLLSVAIAGVTYVTFARAPMTTDNSYVVPTVWVNSVLKESWLLSDKTDGIALWLKLGANTVGDAQDSVLSIADGNNAPPTEVLLDRYIITDGGGGVVHADWDGASFDDICEFDGATWVSRSPDEGFFSEVEDVDTVYIFTTSWVKLFQASGAIFGTDAGNAVPDATGALNIIGTTAQGLTFAGATNNVTGTIANASDTQKGTATFQLTDFDVTTGNVVLKDTVLMLITTDTGALTIATNAISIISGNGMGVTHAGTTITVAGDNASTTQTGVCQYGTDTQIKEGLNNAKTVVASSLNALMADSTLTGFISWGGAGVYYSVAGTTLTVERAGTGYVKSRLVAWVGGQDTGALTKGDTYWVYMDSAGTIGSTNTRPDTLFQDYIVLFEVLCDNDGTSNVIVVKENHPYDFPTNISNYNHDTIHVVLEGSGAVMAVAATDDIQIIGADVLHDHGLSTTVADSGAAAVDFSFMFTDGTGKWVRDSISTHFPSEYNSAGTMTALTGNKFGIWRCGVSKDNLNAATATYYAIPNTAQYNNLAQARAAITAGMVTFTNELYALEICQLGYVIYEESSSTIVEVIVARSILGTSTASASTNSASLVTTTVANFDGWLSAADTSVQSALGTLDDTAKDGTFHLENTADGTKIVTWDLSGLTTGNSYAITMPDQAIDLTPTTGTYQGTDATLTALAAYNTDGILTQTAADTFTGRTLTGTANQVTVTNGSGVAGNPTFSLPQDIATTSTVQFGEVGIGAAVLEDEQFRLHGTNASVTAMPKMYMTTSYDDYPLMSMMGYTHDNMFITLDCYLASDDWKSSDWGSNFVIQKSSDSLHVKYANGTAPGSAINIDSGLIGIQLESTGEVTMPHQSAFLAFNSATDQDQTGNGTVATVDFDSEVFDQNADFAADTYTAPVTCKMNFQTTVCAGCGATAATGLYVKIVTSNRAYYGSGMQPTICRQGDGALFLTCACIADLDAADTAYVTLTGTAAVADDIDIVGNGTPYLTFFSGAIIC